MKLNKINSETVKGYVAWLKKENMGCCHFNVGDTAHYQMHICVGWHDNGDAYEIAWKIGIESFNNAMQCDLDIDFLMPWDEETGEVYDTLQTIEGEDIDWDALANEMNEAAARGYQWQTGYERRHYGDEDSWAA